MSVIPPLTMFPDYTATATDMTFTLANTNNLSAANADPDTGDGREILRSIIEAAYKGISEMPQADRPKGFNIVKSAPNFVTTEKMEVTYTIIFNMNLNSASIPLIAESTGVMV